MMGRLRSRRAAAEAEGPFRRPAHFALAMPMLAIVALMLVVLSAATDQSARVVAILAVAGLGLCAVAPVALLEIYVARPLRVALAQLRAARDGKESIGAPPTGVIGDLVAVAQDIRAGQSQLGHNQAALSLCERMVAAGDEAIRALRLQSEELAETAVLSESQLRRSAQSQFVEIAEAAEALKSSASAGFDSGSERIEQMLVYLAETLERSEARDLLADGTSMRLEQSLADLARLIGRETEAIRGSVSSASLLVRDDVASTVAAKALARIGEELARLRHSGEGVDELREEIRASASGLAEAIAKLGARFNGASVGEIVARGVAEIGERLRVEGETQAGRLEDVESRVAERILAIERDAEATTLTALMRTTGKLGQAIDRLDALSTAAAGASTSPDDGFRAEVRSLAAEGTAKISAQLSAEIVGLRSAAASDLPHLDALREEVAAVAAALAAISENAKAAKPAPDDQVQALDGRLVELADGFGRTIANEVASADPAPLDALRGDSRGVKQSVAASLSGLAGQITWATPPSPVEAGDPEWREAVDALGGRLADTFADTLADTLSDLEWRRTATAAPAPRSPKFSTSVGPKFSGALAQIVMSLADSLDFRFARIERNLGDLCAKLQAADARRETPAVATGTNALVEQLNSTSETMKTGLSELVGISAALTEDIDANNSGEENAVRQNISAKAH